VNSLQFIESSISSLHIETTAHDVLPHAIKALQDKGYKLVTVAECLGVEAYNKVSDPQPVSPVHLRRRFLPLPFAFRVHGRADRESSCRPATWR
jgi:hypothetical protein